MNNIKMIVFDLDGVYFLDGHSNFKKNLQEKYNLSLEEIIKVYFSSDMMSKVKKGEISSKDFWDFAIKEWNINATREELLDLLVSGYIVNKEALNLINDLKSKGYLIGACTNNFEDRINILNNKFNFLKDFDYVVLSYKEKVIKPNKEIFNRLCSLSNLKPSQIVISDDNQTNIDNLKHLGFNAILYTDFNQFIQELKNLGIDNL
ncbi:MAG: HAD-IA family hydrolase [Candidatus Nanoarchaeia archaeon]|nr:HAD-IA family hydrolase [Candidatus Nanoarchaeia archaeon]